MKTKSLLPGIVLVLLAAAAVWWCWRPQTITLSDGTKLTLLRVEYGKHHKFPAVKATGSARGRGPTAFDTTNNTLVVWILSRHKAGQWPSYQVLACDAAETACVGNWARHSRQIRQGMEVMGIQLDAYPRHDRKFYLRFLNWGARGPQVAKGRMVISNPTRGYFPGWTPDSSPMTQSDGDLEVTLTRLVCGVRGFSGGNNLSNAPWTKAVLAAFHTAQKGVAVTNWQPVQIETSDATGNHVVNNSWSNTRDGDEAVMTYQWGLWPDEPAWKLHVEFSRTSGFQDDELWTVRNLPVEPGRQQDLWNYGGRNRTNSAFAGGDLKGMHLKIFPAKQFTDQPTGNGEMEGGFRVQIDPAPDEMRLTLVNLTDDRGHDIQSWNWGGGGNDYRFGLQELGNARSLNLTLALHRSRFVEFTAKPTKP